MTECCNCGRSAPLEDCFAFKQASADDDQVYWDGTLCMECGLAIERVLRERHVEARGEGE